MKANTERHSHRWLHRSVHQSKGHFLRVYIFGSLKSLFLFSNTAISLHFPAISSVHTHVVQVHTHLQVLLSSISQITLLGKVNISTVNLIFNTKIIKRFFFEWRQTGKGKGDNPMEQDQGYKVDGAAIFIQAREFFGESFFQQW